MAVFIYTSNLHVQYLLQCIFLRLQKICLLETFWTFILFHDLERVSNRAQVTGYSTQCIRGDHDIFSFLSCLVTKVDHLKSYHERKKYEKPSYPTKLELYQRL